METSVKSPSPNAPDPVAATTLRMQVRNLNFYYGKTHALHGVNLDVATNKVTALIGPSGCGKSTLLRTLNRMHETVRHSRLEGSITLDGEDILAQDVTRLRRRVGMVFQKPNPFPKSIFENVAYGLHINGLRGPQFLTPSSKACAAPRFGMKSRTYCTNRPTNCPAVSSSASASRGRSL